MSSRVPAARGRYCAQPARPQRQDDAGEEDPEQKQQERRAELRVQEHAVDQEGGRGDRRKWPEPQGQRPRLQGHDSDGGHHHAYWEHGDHEGDAVHLVQDVVELGGEPRILGGERGGYAAELDREVYQPGAEGSRREPAVLPLGPAQNAVEVAEEREEEEHSYKLPHQDELRVAADARQTKEQYDVQQPAGRSEPGPQISSHFHSPSG